MKPILVARANTDESGLRPLLSRRVEVCASCHVGTTGDKAMEIPARDMNHDMIAAGHPRLNFEYTAYMANMPPHWKKVTPPDAKSWAIGRMIAAKAAMDLLADRAASHARPWPEFAEHDCFSCHHDLVNPSARQTRPSGSPRRVPGSFLANDWYTAWLPEALSGLPQKDAAAAREQVIALQGLLSTRTPDREKIHVAATELRETLLKLTGDLESWSPTEQDNQAARGILARNLKNDGAATATWDEAAQLYLALVALNHGKPDATSDELLKLLRFDPGFDSPRGTFPFPAKP